MHDPRDEALAELREGLSRAQKELPSRYFYDARGSALFEEITNLPEYYLTRAEREILERCMPRWAAGLRARTVVELGAGSAAKTRIVLDALHDSGSLEAYVPVDVSADFLAGTARALRSEYPELHVLPATGDFTRRVQLPDTLPTPVLVAFLGSTIGNLAPPDDARLLERVARFMHPGDHLLLGTDLRKEPALLEAAYDDSRGVTAEFNRNALRVVNDTFGADFDPSAFSHRAVYDGTLHRVEMHLVAGRAMTVTVPGAGTFRIAEGESIRTEVSCKYDQATVRELLASAGLRLADWATDGEGRFALALAVRDDAARATPASGTSAATFARLRDDVLHRLFTPADPDAPPRVGLEIEVIPVHADTRRPLPIGAAGDDPRTGAALLHDAGRASGWREMGMVYGAPRWSTESGGSLSFEPGGQIEYASPPMTSVQALVRDVQAVVAALRESAARRGAELVELGVDPDTSLADVPLQLRAERYRRMDAYFAARGPAGQRMMRQTAALHVNLDLGADPAERWLRWRVLGRAAPYLTASFATSARYAGRDSGCASYRACTWRELDPARTGVVRAGADLEEAAEEYTRFALAAPWMLDPGLPPAPAAGDYVTFGTAHAAGRADDEAWRAHLTTLFPEVRPRGWLEVRCLDAQPAARLAVPVTALAGLVYDADALRAADAMLGEADPDLLRRAARRGMADPDIAGVAEALVRLGVAGSERLPAGPSGKPDSCVPGLRNAVSDPHG